MTNQQEKDFAKDLGRKIYKLRKKNRLTLRGLGKLVGVSGAYIGNIEKGENIANSFILFKLSKVFGVSLEFLTNSNKYNIDTSEYDPVMNDEKFKEYIELAKKAYLKDVSADDLNNAIRILNTRS